MFHFQSPLRSHQRDGACFGYEGDRRGRGNRRTTRFAAEGRAINAKVICSRNR